MTTGPHVVFAALLLFVVCRIQGAEVANTCNKALGMKTGAITDSQVTASSQANNNYRAANGRLDFTPHDGRTGAWSAQRNNAQQWLQVDFVQTTQITQVATQGRQDSDQWVKTYTLSYSRDGIVWLSYPKVLPGNNDRNTAITNDISPPIIARFVKIHPKTWKSHISLRAEFYGCNAGFCINEEDCAAALGMIDGSISNSQITATTTYNNNALPARARLYLQKHGSQMGAWLARVNDIGQFLQIDIGQATKLTRIATQGRQETGQWVKSYRLTYSQNNGHYTPYSKGKVLPGNTNNDGVHVNLLQPVIITRYIRALPVTWHSHICMRIELYGCTTGFQIPPLPSCESKLVMADDQMSASSSINSAYRPQNARLHFYAKSGRTGAWSARFNDIYQFLEVDFRNATQVARISTQGRQDAGQWVKTYTLEYSMDGAIFTAYSIDGKVKVFTGNNDRYTVVSHVISQPIIARFVRVHPKTWQSHISMRLEFYGCKEGFVPPSVPECVSALGLRSGKVPNAKMTSSSDANSAHGASNARLYFHAGSGRTGSWSASTNNKKQWLQVDFSEIVKVKRVATQGRQEAAQWVKSYSLEFSRDGVFWEFYQQGPNKAVFSGNADQHSVVLHEIAPTIIARFIRIHPVTWHSHISLRAEFYGCRKGFVTPPFGCSEPLGMENKKIPDSHLAASSMYNGNYAPSRARLHIPRQGSLMGAWTALHNDRGQWLQINLGNMTKVARIATQGRQDSNQWVTSYTLSFSLKPNGHFKPYNNDQVFTGNKDRNTLVGHVLEPAIIARVLRIHPVTWHSRIAMRLELYGCTKDFVIPTPPKCESALSVKKDQISASSEANAAHGAANGRLHHMSGGGRTGAWSARANDAYQYLQIHFTRPTKVTRVSTQGRQDAAQWVKTYTLEYSLDGALFVPFSVAGQVRIFSGNTDQHKVVSHVISPSIIVRYIRVRSVTWHSHISMRVEFYGCAEGFEPPPEPECVEALGCQCLTVKDRQFSASSEHSNSLRASNARLHFIPHDGRAGSWSAKRNDKKQWIQLDFASYKTVTRIATQGRQDANQWVTAYTVQYSQDGKSFKTFKEHGKNKVFAGNRDRGSVALHAFNPPLADIRMIRIHPTSWHSHISLRMEVYGCKGEIPRLAKPCSHVLDVGILLDQSGSVGSRHFKEAKDFLGILIQRLKISRAGNHLGMIAFSATATRVASFTYSHSTAAYISLINGIVYSGGLTRTDIALQLANADLFSPSGGDRDNTSDVLIVMTNGRTSEGSVPYKDVLKPLRAAKVHVIAVGIGPDVNSAELLQIADNKAANVIHVEDFEALSTKLNSILTLTCVAPTKP